MRLYNIDANLIGTIECLYYKAISAVYYDNNIEGWFRTTIGVRQGCLHSSTLFNILERIMVDTLEDHEGTVSIEVRTITNLRFADDINGLAGQEQELVSLRKHLDEASTACGMQISAEKTLPMTINTSGISTDITTDNKKLKYLRAIVLDEGSKPDVLPRIAHTTATVTKLSHLKRQEHCHRLQDQTDAFPGHVHIFECMWNVDHNSRHWKKVSVIGDEIFPQTPWYLIQTSNNQQGSENQNWKRHRAVWKPPDFSEKTQTEAVQARHASSWTDQDTRTRRETKRKRWEDNTREWTDLKCNIMLRKAENREEWRKLAVKSPVMPQRSDRLRDRWR